LLGGRSGGLLALLGLLLGGHWGRERKIEGERENGLVENEML